MQNYKHVDFVSARYESESEISAVRLGEGITE
jgi:hypothetical protein